MRFFLQIKLHHDFMLSKDYQKAKYEENRFLHLCQDLKVALKYRPFAKSMVYTVYSKLMCTYSTKMNT